MLIKTLNNLYPSIPEVLKILFHSIPLAETLPFIAPFIMSSMLIPPFNNKSAAAPVEIPCPTKSNNAVNPFIPFFLNVLTRFAVSTRLARSAAVFPAIPVSKATSPAPHQLPVTTQAAICTTVKRLPIRKLSLGLLVY